MNTTFWIILSVIAFLVEYLTLSLTSIWFGLAAIIVALISNYVTNIYTQFFIFSIISVFSLFFYIKKYGILKKEKDEFDNKKIKIIGKENDNYIGKLNDIKYRIDTNRKLEIDEYYIIKEFKGNKVVLED